MNKKQLIIAALATVLSVSAANATSTITGVTDGGSGTFSINPTDFAGDVGYRYYNDFTLGKGDVANLIYRAQNGDQAAIETFINLVQNQIDINGIVNTVRDGKFHNGHAVFVSPNGMVVGASGVLNVGRLSVITPTQDKFDDLTKKDGTLGKINKAEANKVSELMKDGNAPIDIQGYIFSRNGVQLPGTKVDVSGTIVNGLVSDTVFKRNNLYTAEQNAAYAKQQAADLFNQLVNTNGVIIADDSQIQSDGSLVFINSFDKGNSTDGINISGKVVNLTAGTTKNGSVAITNNGANGTNITGTVLANGKLSVYNKKGDLYINGSLNNAGGELAISNGANAKNLTIDEDAWLTSDKDINIVNNGTGKLTHKALVTVANGDLAIINEGANGMTITGSNVGDTVRIINRNGKLEFTGGAGAAKTVSVRNYGSGMDIGGNILAGEGVLIDNYNGDAKLSGSIAIQEDHEGNIAIMNRGKTTVNGKELQGGKLTTTSDSEISTEKGFIAIKNAGSKGMELNGTIENGEGEIAINNLAGAMVVNGEITNTNGNMGIINKENGTGMTIGATIENKKGTLKLVNTSGTNGLTITEDADISNNGKFYTYNEKGHLTINGDIQNANGNLYVVSRYGSTGITTGENSTISNSGSGNLAITHGRNQTAGTNDKGMDLNGSVINSATNGEVAINNYGKADMHVGGDITANNTLGIINRSKGGNMLVDADITAHNTETNIKNEGTGDMTVNGKITHDGRLNIIANDGMLNLGGEIVNNGTDMTYAVAKKSADGIDVKSTFNATANKGGTILIKNISGSKGLNYDGTMSSTKQAELYNKTGDITVTGAIEGHQAVVLNRGTNAGGMTVTDKANLTGDVLIVNRGSKSATIPNKYKNNFREKLNTTEK